MVAGGREFLTVVKPPLTPVGTCGRKPRCNGITSNQVLIIRIITRYVGSGIANVELSRRVNLLTQALSFRFIDIMDDTLKDSVDWPVIGKSKRRSSIVDLLQYIAFPEYTITPGRYPGFLSDINQY